MIFNRPLKLCSSVIFVVIIYTVTACVFSGNKPSPAEVQAKAFIDFKNQVSEIVHDQHKKDTLFTLINGLERDVNTLTGDISDRKKRIKKLNNANFHTSRQQFDAAFAEINASIQVQRKAITGKYKELRTLLNEEEKEQLNKYNSELIEAFALTLKSA